MLVEAREAYREALHTRSFAGGENESPDASNGMSSRLVSREFLLRCLNREAFWCLAFPTISWKTSLRNRHIRLVIWRSPYCSSVDYHDSACQAFPRDSRQRAGSRHEYSYRNSEMSLSDAMRQANESFVQVPPVYCLLKATRPCPPDRWLVTLHHQGPPSHLLKVAEL
jgi:hypothetical protein